MSGYMAVHSDCYTGLYGICERGNAYMDGGIKWRFCRFFVPGILGGGGSVAVQNIGTDSVAHFYAHCIDVADINAATICV